MLVKAVKKINSKNRSPASSGLYALSMLVFFNILTFLIPIASSLINPVNIKILCILIIAIVGVANYFMLMFKGKDLRIITFYEEKFKAKRQNKTDKIFIVLYVILSIVLMIYVATLKRNNQI